MAHYHWKMSRQTRDRFAELLDQQKLARSRGQDPSPILGEIRSLPGFPLQAHPDDDIIHVEIMKPLIVDQGRAKGVH